MNTISYFILSSFSLGYVFPNDIFSVLYERNTVLPINWFVSCRHPMILCCAIFSYPSDSDIEGEFLVEFVTPEHPCYIKNLLDRLSKLTEGILMVNSSLVNVLLIVTTRNFHSVYTASPSSVSLLTPERPDVHVRGKYGILIVKLKALRLFFFNEYRLALVLCLSCCVF